MNSWLQPVEYFFSFLTWKTRRLADAQRSIRWGNAVRMAELDLLPHEMSDTLPDDLAERPNERESI
jgi:hypothetical protein